MRNIIKYILILIILVIIFVILKFCKSNKNIFDDIIIFGLWDEIGAKNEYEIVPQDTTEIDVFSTINNTLYKKIAPGSSGSFTIKFKKPAKSHYKIVINEKTAKPENLVFILDNQRYKSLKEIENIINEKFFDTSKIKINWEWEYYINGIQDIQDTSDGEKAQKYIFEINAIIEEERTEI